MKINELIDNNGDIVKTIYNLKRINSESIENLSNLIKKSENIFHNQIEDIIDDLMANDKIKILMVSGPSSSGKTTTSKLITEYLKNHNKVSHVISLDNFFLDRSKSPKLPDGNYDYENITCLDLEYLNDFIDDLLTTGKAMMPIYNFISGKREDEYVPIVLDKNDYVVFEGIHALNPQLLNSKHKENICKLYVCLNSNFVFENIFIPAKDIRLMRRILRDFYERGHSITSTLNMWNNVLTGEELYIKPFKNTADYLIDSTHMYEPLLYANYLKPLLQKSEDARAKKLLSHLEKCNPITHELMPPTSLLWEFLVGVKNN